MRKTLSAIIVIIFFTSITSCSTNVKQEKANAYMPKYDSLAAHIDKTGYMNLFLRLDYKSLDSIWQDGRNENALLEIVEQRHYDDYARVLASEILFHSQKNYPAKNLEDTLAYIYARALSITGGYTYRLMGNQWGFMYFDDNDGIIYYGELGTHLMQTGNRAVPYLKKMLNDTNMIFYEGSKDAMIGNGMKYRVKDAAAYYIGKMAGIPVKFHENNIDRDAEIESLKQKLK